MYQTKVSLLLAGLFVVAAMGCIATPIVAAEEFPTYTTKIQLTNLLNNYDVVAYWRRIMDSVKPADAGLRVNRIDVSITIDEAYAETSGEVLARTRVHALITAPDNTVVFTGFLTSIGWQPGNVDGYWGLSRIKTFDSYLLENGTYTIIITYDILIGSTWTNVDVATHFAECEYPTEPPDVPTDADPTDFLPIMLSFGVIAGMGFIGFNLARGRDPVPGLFMMFAGVVLAWGMGWLPTWVFVTAIALISLLSAALWGKLFKGR